MAVSPLIYDLIFRPDRSIKSTQEMLIFLIRCHKNLFVFCKINKRSFEPIGVVIISNVAN